MIQQRVIQAFEEEKARSKLPGYVPSYDDFDADDHAGDRLEPPTVRPSSRRRSRGPRSPAARTSMPVAATPVAATDTTTVLGRDLRVTPCVRAATSDAFVAISFVGRDAVTLMSPSAACSTRTIVRTRTSSSRLLHHLRPLRAVRRERASCGCDGFPTGNSLRSRSSSSTINSHSASDKFSVGRSWHTSFCNPRNYTSAGYRPQPSRRCRGAARDRACWHG